jgi:hypothetical protein
MAAAAMMLDVEQLARLAEKQLAKLAETVGNRWEERSYHGKWFYLDSTGQIIGTITTGMPTPTVYTAQPPGAEYLSLADAKHAVERAVHSKGT